MSEIKQIAEGYWNLLRKKTGYTNAEVEQLANLRLDHCGICQVNNQPGLVNGRCILCNCVMESKARAINAKCPVGKW
jgi:hypothetical protein